MLLRCWCALRSLGIVLFLGFALHAQTAPPPSVVAGIPVNYEEALAGTYQLPDPLRLAGGKPVRDAKTWFEKRRPEIVRLFEQNQFGRSPGRPAGMSFDVFDKGSPAFGGKALRKQVTIYFSADKSGPKMDLLIYLPAAARTPAPLLLNLSFSANSSVVDDPGVKPGEIWSREKKKIPASSGRSFGKLNIAPFLEQGIGVATVYYGDIEPDFPEGIAYGVRRLYLKSGQSEPAPDEWGAIAAWAWGLSRAMDHVDQLPVDAHMLLALIAPRPLFLQTGDQDLWSDPKGEFLAAVAASPVYRLLGKPGLETDHMPPAGQAILHTLGYEMHSGGHGALASDWKLFLEFLQS